MPCDARQRQQARQQRADRRRDRAGECGRSWRAAAGRRGPGQRPARAGCGRLHVRHDIGTRVGIGQHCARFAGGQRRSAAERRSRATPAGGSTRATCTDSALACRGNKAAQPAAATLSGWPSSAEASSRMRSESQPSSPKCTASAMAASRPAADEPQPIPSGIRSPCGSPEAPPADRSASSKLLVDLRESGCLQAGSSAPHRVPWRRSKTLRRRSLRSRDRSREPRRRHRIPARGWPMWPAAAAGDFPALAETAAHPALPFIAASTAAGVASTADGIAPQRVNLALHARPFPRAQAAFRDESRWCSRRP